MTSTLISLIITLLIENFFGIFLFAKQVKKKALMVITAANLLTNPLLSFYINVNTVWMSDSGSSSYFTFLIVAELLVILVEAFIFRKYLKVKAVTALLISAFLNIVSAFLGLIIIITARVFLYQSVNDALPY